MIAHFARKVAWQLSTWRLARYSPFERLSESAWEGIENFAPKEKETFSACGAEGLVSSLKSSKVRDIVLCGMEAHICILNTCLDLLEAGFHVFVAADAVSARSADNTRVALERMRDAGAVIVSAEMVLFELLGRAATDEFKEILKLVR